jgi:hypothetical protein
MKRARRLSGSSHWMTESPIMATPFLLQMARSTPLLSISMRSDDMELRKVETYIEGRKNRKSEYNFMSRYDGVSFLVGFIVTRLDSIEGSGFP